MIKNATHQKTVYSYCFYEELSCLYKFEVVYNDGSQHNNPYRTITVIIPSITHKRY